MSPLSRRLRNGVQLLAMGETVYLSMGSNIGDRRSHLQEAIHRTKKLGAIKVVSSFYETEPVDFADQPWFLNCVVGLETSAPPERLMVELLKIEQNMGRLRMQSKGPRLIDIDILLFGDRVIDRPELKIPHPAMHRRRFVLEPLAEIAPRATHPLLRKSVSELLDALPGGQTVRRTAEDQRPTTNDQRPP